MKSYQFAFKNLIRSKTRTALTVLSIALTSFILFLVLSLDRGFKSSVREDLVDGIGAHLFITRGGCPMDAASIIAQGGISPMYIPESVFHKIKGAEGVTDIMPFKIFSITTSDGMRTDIFCGLTKAVENIKRKWRYKSGGWFKDENSVVLGADIAALEKRQVGEMIYVEHFDREFEVAGILEYAYNQDDGMFFLPLNTAQELINREGKLSAVAVKVEDINAIGQTKANIKALLEDDYLVITPEAIGQDVMNFFDSTRTIMYAVLFFTLIVSTVGIANTIITMIYERRKEFAYLKCVGAGHKDIYRLIIEETFIICQAGLLLGLTAGAILSGFFEGYVKEFLLTGFISRSANIIRPGVDLAIVSYGIVMLIGFIAAMIPAIRISGIMPMEAIRNE